MAQHVLLTGGNGFIAVHIINILLERGYHVTTTVRSENKTTYLYNKFATAANEGRLRFSIVEDITVPGAFDQVLKSNDFGAVLHTSSPFTFEVKDVKNDILLPALKGTTEILKSVKAHGPGVKRVVVTSSFAAIMDIHKGNRPGYAYSERDWSPITEAESESGPGLAYVASKTFAEKAAWDFIKDENPGFDLATICPTWVFGPMLQDVTDLNKLNASSTDIYSILSGKTKELNPPGGWLWVDVRDCALAHVLAMEKPEAGNHRFFIAEGTFNFNQVADLIWKYYPERGQAKGIPKSMVKAGYPPEGVYTCDNSQSRQILGLKYTSFEKMLKDTLDQFVILEKQLGVE